MAEKAQTASETFADVFRRALGRQGFTLSELRHRLGQRGSAVSLASLSYWRSGGRQPDLDKVGDLIADIEEILGLESGELAGRITRRRSGRTPLRPAEPVLTIDQTEVDYVQLFEEARLSLECPPSDWFREISLQETYDVDAQGEVASATTSIALECVEGTISRVMYGCATSLPVEDPPRFGVLEGGRSAGEYIHADRILFAVAVELETPLKVGDTGLITVRIDYPPSFNESMEVGVATNRETKKLGQWVRFDPDGVPDWILAIEATPEGERKVYRGLDTPTSVHQVRWDFGPGSLAFRWGYGEPPAAAEGGASAGDSETGEFE